MQSQLLDDAKLIEPENPKNVQPVESMGGEDAGKSPCENGEPNGHAPACEILRIFEPGPLPSLVGKVRRHLMLPALANDDEPPGDADNDG